MGVRGLWEVVAPVAKPITLESLANKRLAVDASIWIYQFLKAVRDSNGNVLKNAHIIGFFRRICKLLYYGIKPVFVFDGEAPVLKRQTLARRNERRLGKQESSSRTAAKILSVQLQRLAQDKGKTKTSNAGNEIPENAVYFDEVSLPESKRSNKQFRSLDQYHLPDIETPSHIDENDPRLMTAEELEEYAKEVQSLSSVGLFDTSKIDFNSPEFKELPKTTQFQLLNVARLRSRLRMGYSADQLSNMFPNRMEFSKFQIDRVAQRNFLTQKILGLVGFEEDLSQRLAGEKGGRYLLKKNDANDGGGWTLALQNPENEKDDIITIDANDTKDIKTETITIDDENEDSDEEWEDVPIETTSETKKDEENKNSEQDMDLPGLSGFEENIQRENLYRRIREEQDTEEKQTHKAKQSPRTPTIPKSTTEDELLNKLFPKELSNGLKFTKTHHPSAPNAFDDLFKSNIPLFDESSVPENLEDKSDGRNGKKTDELPPWFSADVSKQPSNATTIDTSESTTASDGNFVERGNDIEMNKNGNESQDAIMTNASEHVNSQTPNDKIHLIQPTSEGISTIKEPPLSTTRIDVIDISSPGPEQNNAVVDEESRESSDEAPARELDPAELELAEEEEKYEENENEELVENMVKEVEENERFAKTLNNGAAKTLDYEKEIRNLKQQQRNDQRDADSVTQEMVSECQELLTRFGIPYITAPTEAEAQCASLTQLGLVDGIVTDDGDCLLFGGKKVYKNMFNQSKFVECYELADIEHELGLNRDKLIDLALLLGSDYTDGLPGIGPVTAVELLADFSDGDSTLFDFSNWWKEIQRGKKEPETDEFRQKFRKRFGTKLFLPTGFPDNVVKEAYLHPAVDDDASEFVWGVPDLDSLRTYLVNATGWPLSKVNELLVPVIKDINKRLQKHKHLIQTSLKDFGKNDVSARRKLEISGSKRMKRAMTHLIQESDERQTRRQKQ